MKNTTITESAVISCNVSYKTLINVKTLVGVLSGKIPVKDWQFHMDTFFNELPYQYQLGVIKENGLTVDQVIKVFYSLPQVFQGKNFKKAFCHE